MLRRELLGTYSYCRYIIVQSSAIYYDQIDINKTVDRILSEQRTIGAAYLTVQIQNCIM